MTEKTVSKAIKFRRSVRKYDASKTLNKEEVRSCIQQATLAPTSSNLQLWEFYHITKVETLKEIATACFNQSAAATASQLVVAVVRKDLWKKRVASNIKFLEQQFGNQKVKNFRDEKKSMDYYKKIVPTVYSDFFGFLGLLKKLLANSMGLFRPMYREVSLGDLRVIAHKSAALAAQNFMISMAAIGYDTCPMEGSDTWRVKRLLDLPCGAEINMIVSCGIRKPEGVYGERFRIPFDEVYRRMGQ